MKAIKILERALVSIPIMFGVAIIVFLFMRLTPGDPVDIMMGRGGAVSAGEIEKLRSEFHLDQPLARPIVAFSERCSARRFGIFLCSKNSCHDPD